MYFAGKSGPTKAQSAVGHPSLAADTAMFGPVPRDPRVQEPLYGDYLVDGHVAVHGQVGLAQVPSSHPVTYFTCASVSVSMVTPMDLSLMLAISWSISLGTA